MLYLDNLWRSSDGDVDPIRRYTSTAPARATSKPPTSPSRIQKSITKPVFFPCDAREPISMRQGIALAPTVIDLQENRLDQAATGVEGTPRTLEYGLEGNAR